MLLAPPWVFPLSLPSPLPQLPVALHSRGTTPDPHYPQDETWECTSSCGPALPGLVPVGNGREVAVALCGGTARSGVSGTPGSTGTSPELALPSSSACGARAAALPAGHAAAPLSCAWVPQAALHKGPGPTSSPPPLTLLCPTGSQCRIPCPGTSSLAGARLWGIPHHTKS